MSEETSINDSNTLLNSEIFRFSHVSLPTSETQNYVERVKKAERDLLSI
jgi:hypothetical protein